MRRLSASLVLVLFGSAPALAQPDPCDPPPALSPIDTTPASGARAVTLDAPIKVRYPAGFLERFAGDPLSIVSVCERPDPVLGSCIPESCDPASPDRVFGDLEQVGDDVLFFYPDGGLAPNARYDVTAAGEPPLETCFLTGTELDSLPPVLGQIERVSADKATITSCGPPEGSYRVDVQFPAATDDGPPASIEYRLFLTRARNLEAPELRATRRNFTTELVTMAFVLGPDEAAEPICVAVHAVDGVGRVDDDGVPVCFDPVDGNFFEPLCAVTTGGRPTGTAPLMAVMASMLLWVRRRRARARPARSRTAVPGGRC